MRNKEKGSYKASKFFNVPETTLQRYVKEGQKSSSETLRTKLGRNQVLPCEVEKYRAQHCRLTERKIVYLTMADVMRLAYLLAVRNGIRNQFLREMKRLEGSGWKIFLLRHQEIPVITTECLHSQERGVSLLNQ